MHFALTDEQRALQDTVTGLLADRFPPSWVRAQVYDADPTIDDGDPEGLWRTIGEQGWLAALVPEDYDGLGLGLLDAAVISRCFGAGVVPGPWLPTVLAGEAVRLAGSDEQRARWLPRLAAGEVKGSIAVRREGGGWGAEGVGVVVADDGTLTGSAGAVEYANTADVLVVAARGAGGDVGLHLVDPADPEVTLTRGDALDRTTRLSSVEFDGASGAELVGGSALVLADLLDRAAVLVAADLAGTARAALSLTVAYDKERTQFGRPVGSFQAIKHALADLHVAVTMAEHGVRYAAHALDVGRDDARLMVSVAKAKASDAARDSVAAMIQYHGGIAYTWEHDAHFYFKRAKRQEHSYGDATTHRERIARLVVDDQAAALVDAGQAGADSGATANASAAAASATPRPDPRASPSSMRATPDG